MRVYRQMLGFILLFQATFHCFAQNRTLNRTERSFWGHQAGGGIGGVGGSGGSGGGFPFSGLGGFGNYYNPNRISDCPTSEYNRTGICTSSAYECRSRGGRVVGQCYATPISGTGSSGVGLEGGINNDYNYRRIPVGICCVYQVTCGGTILHNGTYFRSPNAPATYNEARACSVSIPRIQRHILQIKFEFVTFSLKQPTVGVCDIDKLIIDGQSQNNVVPAICGYNSGQHIYLEIDRGNNPITLTVLTGTGSNFNRHFDIRITFIHYLSPYRAPPNCLQYHYHLHGEFKSFNFDYNNFNQVKYLKNMDYAICFRKMPGFCSITYSMPKYQIVSDNDQQQPNQPVRKYFNIVNNVAAGTQTTSGAGPVKCPDDFIMLNTLRFCGNVLSDDYVASSSGTTDVEVTDNGSGPLMARFVTNDDDKVGSGFLLFYRLNHCFFGG